MNGPEHYRAGEQALSAASHLNEPGGRPLDPHAAAHHLALAQAHFAAAQAAAAALRAALPLVGDDHQVTEWGRAIGLTFTSPDSVRVADARTLLADWETQGLIGENLARDLRAALGVKDGDR